MTAPSPDYAAYVVEQLAPVGDVASGRFFGGIALSAGGLQFAMMMGNTLYFAVNEATRPKYLAMGSTCFAYNTKKGRVEVKRYQAVPADVLEDPASLVSLAREAIEVARTLKKSGVKKSSRRHTPGL